MKRILAKCLNTIPYGFYRSFLGDYVPILMLHRSKSRYTPDGHDLSFIADALAYIRKKKFNPISLEALVELHRNKQVPPPNSIVFTIDDGFKDNIVDTGDVFSQFDVPLTCFVITNFVDVGQWPWDDRVKYALSMTKRSHCDLVLPDGETLMLSKSENGLIDYKSLLRDRLKRQSQTSIYDWLRDILGPSLEVDIPESPPEGFEPASWQDICRFVAAGHSVAPHTENHKILSMLDEREVRSQILGSISKLKEHVAHVPPIFAYPTGRQGDFTEREYKICESLGLKGAVSTVPGYWSPNSNPFAIPRFSMPDTEARFLQYIGAMEAMKECFKRL